LLNSALKDKSNENIPLVVLKGVFHVKWETQTKLAFWSILYISSNLRNGHLTDFLTCSVGSVLLSFKKLALTVFSFHRVYDFIDKLHEYTEFENVLTKDWKLCATMLWKN
jgi:hypothetical protein